MNDRDRFFLSAALAAVRSIQLFWAFTLGCMIVFSLTGQGCLPGLVAAAVIALLIHDRAKENHTHTDESKGDS